MLFRSVVNFSLRHKIKEWMPEFIRIELKNGKIFMEPFYASNLGSATSIYLRPSCHNCYFKDGNRVGDITIGDYWHAKISEKYYNKLGTSLIICNTPKGKEMLNALDDFILAKPSYNYSLKSNFGLHNNPVHPKRNIFSTTLKNNTLNYTCKKVLSRKNKIKQKLFKHCPKTAQKIIYFLLWAKKQNKKKIF